MNTPHPQDYLTLRRWFINEIRRRNISHEKEAFSYDANTAYDYAYYRLQAEAKTEWIRRYGAAPSDEILAHAFFDAEIDKFSRRRNWRHPLGWMRRRVMQLIG